MYICKKMIVNYTVIINYNTETGYGEIIGNGQLMVADNILTGVYITAFTNEISATAKGNVNRI